MLSSREFAAISLGGAAGALLRAVLVQELPSAPTGWPWVTFAVNLAGCALLGLVSQTPPGTWRRPLIGTGFCGALTTFSALQLELLRMLDAGRLGLAIAYGASSLLAGGLLVLGTRRFVSRPETA